MGLEVAGYIGTEKQDYTLGATAGHKAGELAKSDYTLGVAAGRKAGELAKSEADSFLSDKCSDGNDDGKIGFFNALGHTVKGAGKTLINTVKGCFTDENGDLSLGKTLLTLGAGAACIAFPPLGLAACAVGGTLGAVKVGQGVYNAAAAKTDAEAKQAWQQVGEGVFTAGSSAVGARASLGAVKASSTAGKAGNSAISELSKDASLTEKLSALGQDVVSSTKNNAALAKEQALTLKDKASSVASSIKDKISKPRKFIPDGIAPQKGKLSPDIEAKSTSIADKIKTGISEKIDLASNKIKQTETGKAAKSFTDGTEFKKGIIDKAQVLKQNLTKENFSKLYDGLSADAKAILQALKNHDPESVISKYGYENVLSVLKAAGGNQVASNQI